MKEFVILLVMITLSNRYPMSCVIYERDLYRNMLHSENRCIQLKYIAFSLRKKLSAKVTEMEEALQAAEMKAQSLEKVKNRMNGELEDLVIDLEKVSYL